MRILLVEDDRRIRGDLLQALAGDGHVVDVAVDGEEAWFRGDTEQYDAVILDLGLPRLDGLSVLKRWRSNGRTMPVLILTARSAWLERVEGIDAGADDYLVKPFHIAELMARLRAITRRGNGQCEPRIIMGDLVLDERQMQVTRAGAPVPLTALEYRALHHLLRHRGSVVSQAELIEHVYGSGAAPESNALEVNIARLRRKLGSGVIETRRGFGYIVP